ncbi:hypothetical protein JQC67_18725 [Aurantibacter crassamenti]|uniref:hypothetical protein n=1 Tax=Aurantibacter crassamenti TaxID=1837375 RepID=UPI00193A1A64|nr:hypothetical protein [Aurantibacter crassamenti]MBM1108194.1 hypothetical protein [Aurantibacter crassamenti]
MIRKTFYLGFLSYIFLVMSCKEKSFSEYSENEFYKVQGVIVSAKLTSSILDDPFMKEIKYKYFINDSLILEGSEDFSFMDMDKGIPIEVLVHKENKDVSFYWRNGYTENITAYQLEYVRKKMEEAIAEIKNQ